jgi:phosphate transport system protein
MAVDLRAIVSAVKINTDLERVGDLAINIAEAARRYTQLSPVKKLIDIPRMATIAQSMLRDALDAFVRRDTDLAQRVLNEDDKLDALKTQIFRELLTYMLQDPATIEPALDLILISRHLERIGDHATNIAEDVIFMVSARDVRHHADESQTHPI